MIVWLVLRESSDPGVAISLIARLLPSVALLRIGEIDDQLPHPTQSFVCLEHLVLDASHWRRGGRFHDGPKYASGRLSRKKHSGKIAGAMYSISFLDTPQARKLSRHCRTTMTI